MQHKYLDKKSLDTDYRYTLASDNFKVDDDNDNDNEYIKNIKEGSPKNPLIILGMNPSDATEIDSDDTINNVIKLIELNKNKYDGWVMINVFAYRQSDSDSLISDEDFYINYENLYKEIHDTNIKVIKELLKKYDNPSILLAFGEGIIKQFYLSEMFNNIYVNIKNIADISWLIVDVQQEFLPLLTSKSMPRHLRPRGNGYFKIEEISLRDAKPYLEPIIVKVIKKEIKKNKGKFSSLK